MNIRRQLDDRLTKSLAAVTGQQGCPAMVAPSGRPEFGDYQANGVMSAAKAARTHPRKLAEQVVAAADLADLAESVQVAGPGFINIRLRAECLAAALDALAAQPDLLTRADRPQTIVIDYSHPNIAREMHVGHLRSTIIGDAMARLLEFLGHKVVRQNHVGDWGTQFGRVVLGMWHLSMAEKRGDPEYFERTLEQLRPLSTQDDAAERRKLLAPICEQHQADLDSDPDGNRVFRPYVARATKTQEPTLDRLLGVYRFVNRVESLAQGTGLEVAKPGQEPRPLSAISSHVASMLQRGLEEDEQEREAWRYARTITLDACHRLYDRLGVLLKRRDVRGESAYNDELPNVIAELDGQNLVQVSQGAKCVFLDEFTGKDGKTLPVIVQKSDGGYLYATTDLAAIRYRVGQLQADRILYVVDARQTLHLRQVFAVARKAGFAPGNVSLEHVAFGTMLGADGRPFKTREGGTVKLMALLDEAEQRAFDLVSQKSPDMDDQQRRRIARIVGIGAVKYADLAQNRTSDYVFSFNRMLSLEGNTAPYMQYAYARIRSIFRKGGLEDFNPAGAGISLREPAERTLGLKLLQLPETLQTVADECLPNLLCGYLHDLAVAFTGFYENCPVLQSDEPLRSSRLALCELTARTIRQGLDLLGIETVEQM